ncbi:DUF2155 domain-containing protein [Ponticoccus sp. SC2-23]|uniref:DUF2155 domain-containing protein n=1 Tax=Alexandriicola marinus TaxID=2081710 RepID=UPI000FD7AB63|nr:DUF2155 domain-containing protein [Alexandriicola marinus]MBM1219544.1 DUF2155 domain-containing protein [Ponticoccus sp. SC6-9]MBM1223384.1 DUF2155 domain-containing protein [Ponticoccus sp. SC6-15]MBM1229357.1 DUF2155 domain-containing protein [Ponticoccus sp. SC6-38]MBM1232350.1 DUF2155 domain-containing protein [Ponticoccus sp. SC6-45]MBM1237700.1 DUF2155 domain-containing protein [Ponticoccus sp. SC6-49]MBM1241361.1 DUF2155 domain-containing protein [Ponticoccus sp. SC2-64]MBM1245874
MRLVLAAAFLSLSIAPLSAQQASTAPGGVLRVLDKITSEVRDIRLRNGETGQVGLLRITLDECRYPANNPSGDAYAMVTIQYRDDPEPVFRGWMIASEPSISAMEHPRYDVWPQRCSTS